VAHAAAITVLKTDVDIVPFDCDLTDHNLLILPTSDVELVLSKELSLLLGTISN
tara:strand:- start:367 stop:528 length:162 start_codon:yes stop_codon:yes gene_type:complete